MTFKINGDLIGCKNWTMGWYAFSNPFSMKRIVFLMSFIFAPIIRDKFIFPDNEIFSFFSRNTINWSNVFNMLDEESKKNKIYVSGYDFDEENHLLDVYSSFVGKLISPILFGNLFQRIFWKIKKDTMLNIGVFILFLY